MAKKINVKDIAPISKDEKEDWDKLIAKTRSTVDARDKTIFDLIILAGQVEKKYGENRIGMWADQAGLSWSSAKQYRWMANKGVGPAFIKKWARTKTNPTGLTFSVIREIAGFHGSLKSPYALESLEWAVEHKSTVISVRGYMWEFTAPRDKRENATESFKLSLKDKQEHEGFSDYVASKLAEMVEENPELEDAVLRTAIVGKDDLEKLESAAGIKSLDDEILLQEAKKQLGKIKRMRDYLVANRSDIVRAIETGHELSDPLKDALKYLADDVFNLWTTEVKDLDIPTIEVNLAS
jgi:hypothetical protein